MAAENFKVKKGLEVGTAITATSSGVNVTGIVTATQFVGDGSGLTGVTGSGSGVVVKDEGSAVGTAGTINFVGSGVAATLSQGTATVTINSGGLSDVVADTTPQLGGNLDLNGKFVNGTGGVNVTGVVTATGADINGNIDVSGTSTLNDDVTFQTANTNNLVLDKSDNSLKFGDSVKAKFGTGSDLEIYHDTAASIIENKNLALNLYSKTDIQLRSEKGAGMQVYAIFRENGNNEFRFNNSIKLETTNIGIKATGQVEATTNMLINGTNGSLFFGTGTTYGSNAGIGIASNDGFHVTGSLAGDLVLAAKGGENIVFGTNSSGFTTKRLKIASDGNVSVTNNFDVDGQTDLDDLVVSGVGTFSTRIDTNGVSLGTNNNTFAAKFVDDAVANFGTDNDLKIRHISSTNQNRIESTTGSLMINQLGNGSSISILATNVYLKNHNNNETYLHAVNNGAVRLYYDNNVKFATSNAGATVTGTLTATAFSGDGSALTGVTASGSGIIVRHDGNVVGTASSINFSTNLDVSAISAGIVTVTASGGGGGGLSNIVEDTTPQLGGNLDVNTKNIIFGDSAGAGDDRLVFGAGSDLSIYHDGTNSLIENSTGTFVLRGDTFWLTDKASNSGMINANSAGAVNLYFNGVKKFETSSAGATVTGTLRTGNGSTISFSDNVNLEDSGASTNNRVKLGNGDDLQLYHDGTRSHLSNTTGELRIGQGGTNVELYNSSAKKFETTQTGVVISGIATATTFSGSGASLTALNASNLGSGTIPNGRFPATLPATSGANLTSLNASEITSGTLPIARIADDAVTFAKMQNVGTGVFIGRNDGGTGDIETLTAAEARTLLNVADGATAGITTSPDNVVGTWSVTANGSSAYRFTGPGQSGNEDNPDIYLVRGQRYSFINTTGSSHPFRFRVSSGGSTYSDGVSGSENGTQYFNVQHDAPASLVYQCTIHGGMVGNIYIVGQHLANGADNRVLTATSAYGMNGESNLTFDAGALSVNDGSGEGTVKIGGQNTSTGGTLFYEISGATYLRIKNLYRSNSSNGNNAYIEYDGGYHKFLAGQGGNEKVRIDSSGRVLIGTTTEGEASADNLTIADSGNCGITIRSGTSNAGGIYFSDGTSGDAEYRGLIAYNQSSDYLQIFTSAAERLRIDAGGGLQLGTSTATASKLTVYGANDAAAIFQGSGTGTGAGNGFLVGNNGGTDGLLWNYENGNTKIATNNVERLRITSGGTVNIGTNVTNTTGLVNLSTNTSTNNTELIRLQNSHTDGKMTVMGFNTDGLGYSQTRIYGGNDNTGAASQEGDSGAGKFKVTITNPSGTHQEVIYAENDANTASKFVRLSTNGSERLRIDSSGRVLIGRTSQSNYGNLLETKSITVETDGDTTGMHFNRTDSNAAWVAMRFYAYGSQSGYIQVNTSSTTYSTSSDYRLKENVVSISDGIARLKTLKPYKFNFIEDATKTVDGFFAHEVTAVPEAVSGEKDAVDEDGNPDYQVIDHSKLVPLLTAALQEEIAKREEIEAKYNALEARISALEGS